MDFFRWFIKLPIQLCIGIFLSFIGLLLFKAYQLGEFRNTANYNIDGCESVPIPKPFQECEDIGQLSDGSFLISCGALHDVLHVFSPHYIPYFNYQDMSTRISNLPKQKFGTIYRLTKETQYKKPIEMKLLLYGAPDFQPHGISIIKHNNNDFIFIVNHRRDGEFISVFKVDYNSNELRYWTSIKSNSFNYINGVAIKPNSNGDFYHTNWVKYDPGSWYGIYEAIFNVKGSQVQYCQTPDNFLDKRSRRHVKADCKVVIDDLLDANGITLTKDASKLYVVQGHILAGYTVHKESNDVKLSEEIDMKYPCDNVNQNAVNDNELTVACFPKPLTMLYKLQSYPAFDISGMIQTVRIDGLGKKREPIIIDADGKYLSGVTGAIQNSNMVIGMSYFDTSRYMVCNLARKATY